MDADKQRAAWDPPDRPRRRIAELRALIVSALGADLLGLYLFGSLATGDFHAGRSDLDLFAVLASEFDDDSPAALDRLHSDFAARYPEWDDRVEVGYVPRSVLASLRGTPRGGIAVISPGEPFHVREISADWLINWHGVCTQGEILFGRAPLELGPRIDRSCFQRAVLEEAAAWAEWIESADSTWPSPNRGYAIVTMCRCLYALRHGEQASKEGAARWAAHEFPEWAELVRQAVVLHRPGSREGVDAAATLSETRRFVRFAAEAAARL